MKLTSKWPRMLRLMFTVMAMVVTGGAFSALSASAEISRKEGQLKSYPVLANAVIYKGALVCVDTNGYAIAGADAATNKFVGVAFESVTGGASNGLVNVKVWRTGVFLLPATSITQAMVGSLMYLVDDGSVDNTVTNVPVGRLVEYVSNTEGWVDIQTGAFITTVVTSTQRFVASNFTTKTDNYNVLAGDTGKVFAIATDAKAFTLPACAPGLVFTFVNTGADGNNIITINPQAADGIGGGGLTGVANKDLVNTKATAVYGDFVTIVGAGTGGVGSLGWIIVEKQGIWAKEG